MSEVDEALVDKLIKRVMEIEERPVSDKNRQESARRDEIEKLSCPPIIDPENKLVFGSI